MKTKTWLAIGLSAALLAGCNEFGSSKKTSLVSEKDRLSYALGALLGIQAHNQLVERDSIDIDMDVFWQGFLDRYNLDSSKYLLNDSAMTAVINEFSQNLQRKRMEQDSIENAKLAEEGQAFLAKNKTAEGVITTESGLQYKILKEGSGEYPKDTSIVKVNYVGKLMNGKEFDSSIRRGMPAEFPLKAVIPGWTELLKLMKVGTKVQAWLPSELAYGKDGRPPVIPGNSVLEFEVELLEIVKPAAKK